jgi:hypothetical protein
VGEKQQGGGRKGGEEGRKVRKGRKGKEYIEGE